MKLSLGITIAGMIALFVFTQSIKPVPMKISEINQDYVGRTVVVTGYAKSMSVNNGNVFITFEDNESSIKLVMFEKEALKNKDAYNISRLDTLIAEGEVSIYKGEIEIIARKIRKEE
ncbi:MAG: OB-fold nucleic acid binding domain-containing protein [Bacteroidota bacterium]